MPADSITEVTDIVGRSLNTGDVYNYIWSRQHCRTMARSRDGYEYFLYKDVRWSCSEHDCGMYEAMVCVRPCRPSWDVDEFSILDANSPLWDLCIYTGNNPSSIFAANTCFDRFVWERLKERVNQ